MASRSSASMRRRMTCWRTSKAPAGSARSKRRVNFAPARRCLREPGSIPSRMKSLAETAHRMLRACEYICDPHPEQPRTLRGVSKDSHNPMFRSHPSRRLGFADAPQDKGSIPSQVLTVLLIGAILAWPGRAGAQELRSYAVLGDSIPESLTGTPGDPQRGRAVVVNRQNTCILCHPVPFAEEKFQGDK